MSSCEWEMQKALYGSLTSSSGLMALVTGIYDHVPQDTVFPYVVLEGMESFDRSNRVTTLTEIRMAIVVYSRERGSKTALAIMASIKERLHRAALSVSGYTLHSFCFSSSQLQHLADGLTYRGKMEFMAVVEG